MCACVCVCVRACVCVCVTTPLMFDSLSEDRKLCGNTLQNPCKKKKKKHCRDVDLLHPVHDILENVDHRNMHDHKNTQKRDKVLHVYSHNNCM